MLDGSGANQYGNMTEKDRAMMDSQAQPRELTDFEKGYATNPNRMPTPEEMKAGLGQQPSEAQPRELTDFEKGYATNPNRMPTPEEMKAGLGQQDRG
jgi:hypothetical protein